MGSGTSFESRNRDCLLDCLSTESWKERSKYAWNSNPNHRGSSAGTRFGIKARSTPSFDTFESNPQNELRAGAGSAWFRRCSVAHTIVKMRTGFTAIGILMFLLAASARAVQPNIVMIVADDL